MKIWKNLHNLKKKKEEKNTKFKKNKKKIEYIIIIIITKELHQSYFWPYLKMPSKAIRMANFFSRDNTVTRLVNLCSRRLFPDDIAEILMEFSFNTVEAARRNRHNIIMNQIVTAEKSPYYNDVSIFIFWAPDYFKGPEFQYQFQSYFCEECGQYESTGCKFDRKAFRIGCRGQGYRSCRALRYTNIACECGNCQCCKWTLNTNA